MTGDTILFRRGSSFQFDGTYKDALGAPISLLGVALGFFETHGTGMQELAIVATDANAGKFQVTLSDVEAKKLPEGRNSWFKILFDFTGTQQKLCFPPIWLDVR
jgi:hypothetical protein